MYSLSFAGLVNFAIGEENKFKKTRITPFDESLQDSDLYISNLQQYR